MAAPVLYSELPARRTRQVIGDLSLLAWTLLWIWAAMRLYSLMMGLAEPGLAVATGATDLAASITDAGSAVASVPLVGPVVAAPFGAMSDAAIEIAAAGQATADAVTLLARFLAVSLAVIAIASWAIVWVPWRIAFIRRATAARALLRANDDLDLFALRAMARQPLHVLARISDDPAGAWRRGDQRVISELAALELSSEGLRVPSAQSASR